MKKMYILLFTLLLSDCNDSETMEETFHDEMKNNSDVDEYKLVEEVEEDNVIVFSSTTKDDFDSQDTMIAYFEEGEQGWIWKKTNDCPADGWSGNLDGEPYIRCGALTEPKYEEVFVGGVKANVIEWSDSTKRVWYHISNNKNEEIKQVTVDGTKQWLKKVVD